VLAEFFDSTASSLHVEDLRSCANEVAVDPNTYPQQRALFGALFLWPHAPTTYNSPVKTKRRTKKKSQPDTTAFKIRLRSKDGAPLSMQEMRDGLYEAARRLQQYEGTHRAIWVTVYLTMIDEDGNEVLPNRYGQWTIYPYKCAADEFGA
jgi:hypothetical protein